MSSLEQSNSQRQKADWRSPENEGEKEWGDNVYGYRLSAEEAARVLELDTGDGCAAA